LKSFATCPDSAIGTWAESFSLGAFTAGIHTVSIRQRWSVRTPDLIVDHATLTFDVLDSIPPTSPAAARFDARSAAATRARQRSSSAR
jgi:hypothetical protein